MSTSKKSIDEQEEERLFTPRKYTFDEYLSAVLKRRKELEAKAQTRSKDDYWRRFNVIIHADPYAVQLEVIYQMLRHVMWKLTDCQNDVEEMAFAQRGFEAAIDEAEAGMWRHEDESMTRYGLKQTSEAQDKFHLAIDMMDALEKENHLTTTKKGKFKSGLS